jgi:hypothetical protein
MSRFGATQAQPAAAAAPVPAQVPGQHYTYGAEALAIAANATEVAQFQVMNNDFEADFLTAFSTGAFKAQIQVGDRYLSNIPIHSSNIFGTGAAPFPLFPSLRLKKGDIVTLAITDLSAAQNDVRIGFVGRQL